jgi:D-alanine-D-alanine ligase
VIEQARAESARVRGGREVLMPARPDEETLVVVDRRTGDTDGAHTGLTGLGLDVVFPVLHGPYGEDGTVQGLFELANVAYVGCGVLSSAVGMDKAASKIVFQAKGLRVSAWKSILRPEWEHKRAVLHASLERDLGYPMFVKPANLGSSVGITKVHGSSELDAAMALAGEYDRKIIVEAAVPDAREIECAVLGNDTAEASVPGEIIPSREFYDYEAKYLDAGSRAEIPAALPPDLVKEIRRQAVVAFEAIDGSGLARVDFLLSRRTHDLYINEINTLPGFTTISMYAKMWEASGVSYAELVDRLIALAVERHRDKQRLRTSAI